MPFARTGRWLRRQHVLFRRVDIFLNAKRRSEVCGMQAVFTETARSRLPAQAVHALLIGVVASGGGTRDLEGRAGDRVSNLHISDSARNYLGLQASKAGTSTRQRGAPEAMPQHGLHGLPRRMHSHRIIPAGQTCRTPSATHRPGLFQHKINPCL